MCKCFVFRQLEVPKLKEALETVKRKQEEFNLQIEAKYFLLPGEDQNVGNKEVWEEFE